MSFVCEKHERYVPDGEECPYCDNAEMDLSELNAGIAYMVRYAEPLHARLDGSPCLCGSPTCPNPAKPPGET